MKSLIRPALSLFVLLSVLTGLVYPMLIDAIGRSAFKEEAQGSLIEKNGQLRGSDLIGQNFTSPGYFWGRPSATGPQPYNALASSGSNQGPLNPALVDAVKARIQALRDADPHNTAVIPADLLSASASGLDPHISPQAAQFQVARVARVRHLAPARVQALIEQTTEARQWDVFGEPRVNVLRLNLALDALHK